MQPGLLTPEEQRGLLLSVGTHRGRRPLSPIEVAGLFRKMADAGAELSDCAKAAGLEGASQVARFLGLLKLSGDVQHLVEWGKPDDALGFTTAFELSRLANPEDQEAAARAALEHRFTSSEARQLVQLRKRSNKPLDECITAVVRMRPQVEVRHVFVGSVKSPGLQNHLRTLSQYDRDALLREALKDSEESGLAHGKLGVARFTLVGGPDFGALVKRKGGATVEEAVNEMLARRNAR